MVVIESPPREAAIIEFANKWTEQLAHENYDTAFEMLRTVTAYPGRSCVSSSNALRNRIVNYGSDTPIDDEPPYTVTSISSAVGDQWKNHIELMPDSRYPGYVGCLDWWLPLNGEWSDLKASFDIVKVPNGVAFVLVGLRIP
ncbi:hypothetical protein GTP91_16360 [Rugamonas sp. FT82W]|uniref:Uncharacterized protein n=1 Tax=Duganella vulcania TaxID=2692166 RepID=A0A845G5J3_9BURK|nr:hypothetical protein [Duganella vulcania]MYM88742.1 hypothetical protein [Duganella vulcania]